MPQKVARVGINSLSGTAHKGCSCGVPDNRCMTFRDLDARPRKPHRALTPLLLLALVALCAPAFATAAGSATGPAHAAVRKAAPSGNAQKTGTARPKPRPSVQAGKAAPSGPAWGESPAVRAFAQDLAARQGLPQAWVVQQLSKARRVQAVRELIMPPPTGTAKNWAAYRARFIEPERIAAGVAFWNSALPWLQRAEQRWGVPPDLVVGIIGVETFYGRVMGNFRLIDALSTLAFDFPPGRRDRSEFFKTELESLLVQSHAQKRDPHLLKGSYAGATGLPQFMPSSVARWAVDFDNDGRIDLHSSLPDVVGSVAHYLASFGWQQGLPTHHAVTPPPQAPTCRYCWRPTSCPASAPSSWPSAVLCWPKARAQARGCWPWWSCKTVTRRPAMWPARRTSTW